MKCYFASFRKKDGSLRSMKFAKLKDLPPEFLSSKIKGKKSPLLAEGNELVWDLEAQEFRIFNWTTILGNIVETDEKIVL